MDREQQLSVYYDDVSLEHMIPEGVSYRGSTDIIPVSSPHPDQPDRIRNIRGIIQNTLSEYAVWEKITPATTEQLGTVHDSDYIESVARFSEQGGGWFTTDGTGGNEKTYSAAKHAAGGAIQAVRQAIQGNKTAVPYALARPSGHHAQPSQADGSCFFNNAAVAAEIALNEGSVKKVAILDWDVHHSNGTQEIFYDRDDVLCISIHNGHGSWNSVSHPQTGRPAECGTGPGEGYNVNIPVPFGTGNQGYGYVFHYLVEPIISEFDPDILVVSSGTDAGCMDPQGRNLVTMSGFNQLGRIARRLAREYAEDNLAIIQEGGYNLNQLAFGTLAVLEGVLGITLDFSDEPEDWHDDPFMFYDHENLDGAVEAVHIVGSQYARYWPLVFSSRETSCR